MLVADWSRGSIKMAGVNASGCVFSIMPYKDPVKRRENVKRWKMKNKEKVKAQTKKWRERKNEEKSEGESEGESEGGLRVVLTPLTGPVFEACLQRLRRRQKEQGLEKAREQRKRNKESREAVNERSRRYYQNHKERILETKRAYRRNNKEKCALQKREYRKRNREAISEAARRYYRNHEEQMRETQEKWRANNKDRVRARAREYYYEHGEALNETSRRCYHAHREQRNEAKKRWRAKNPDKEAAACRRWRANNPDKVAANNRRRCERYHANKKPMPEKDPLPPPLPCDCGVCLSCGGWSATWKLEWHTRLNAWLSSIVQGSNSVEEVVVDREEEDQPAIELEDLPTDILESEAETMSTASTSEVDSDLGDRLETLLADESDSEVETGPAPAPTRRSTRIAAMPFVSYRDWEEENPIQEILRRKARLHSEAADRIVTRWELLDRRTDRVNTIVNEMTPHIDPHHELDRFQAQLERQEAVVDVVVNDQLFDFFL